MRCLLLMACLLAAAAPAAAESNLPHGVTLPVLRSEVPAGTGTTVAQRSRPEGPRRVDGDASDWHGRATGFGGASAYSRGELVYTDHIFDAYGADEGQDAQRLAVLDPLNAAFPEFYRLDAAYTYAPGEFGVPTGPFITQTNYGNLPRVDEADLAEVRLGTGVDGALELLARTTTMGDTPRTALLVLLDTAPGTTSRTVPFGSGLHTDRAEIAVLLTPAGARAADLRTGAVEELPAGSVAYDPAGFDNRIEARLPASLLAGAPAEVGVAVAAGLADGQALAPLGDEETNPDHVNVANVAFRPGEPSRNWFERQQALELHRGTMDAFFTTADRGRMAAGASERYVPGPGYHDAIFTSTPDVAEETGEKGLLQHYGVYLPSGYDPAAPTPTQYWFHFRGGSAHVAATVVPGVMEDMGEEHHSLVITPDGRGTSGWYVGRSGVDVEQVWRDSHRRFAIDRNRTYIAGHSMGGYASWLLPVMHPDRFAAAFPASPPPTQGAWTGLDLGEEQCASLTYEEYSACFVEANDGDARAEWTTPLLDNLREVPYAIYQGVEDELVPTSGVLMQARRLQELGYRYRLYLFHGQEHYGPPIADQWAEGARYEHRFVRDPNPARVTYVRSMVFENAIERINNPTKATIDFDLSHAYWMSGLEPVDPERGVARVDAVSLAIPEVPHGTQPEADAVPKTDQAMPYTMAGQAWRPDVAGATAAANAFRATLSGARAVRLDLRRMRLSAAQRLRGAVTTEAPLTLTLAGVTGSFLVTVDGTPAQTARHGRALTIDVPAGEHEVVVTPGPAASAASRRR